MVPNKVQFLAGVLREKVVFVDEIPAMRGQAVFVDGELYIHHDDLVDYLYRLETSLYRESKPVSAQTIAAVIDILESAKVKD